jgi:hypothetical protein
MRRKIIVMHNNNNNNNPYKDTISLTAKQIPVTRTQQIQTRDLNIPVLILHVLCFLCLKTGCTVFLTVPNSTGTNCLTINFLYAFCYFLSHVTLSDQMLKYFTTYNFIKFKLWRFYCYRNLNKQFIVSLHFGKYNKVCIVLTLNYLNNRVTI